MEIPANIILIGMPGAGKSTVGAALADALGWTLVDPDVVIAQGEGRPLQDMVDELGLDDFLDLEERYILGFTGNGQVIATGGSVVYRRGGMEHLQGMGPLVHLRLSLEGLRTQLGDIAGRGVVIKPGQTIDDLYHERIPMYETYADLTIASEGLGVQDTVARILAEYGER